MGKERSAVGHICPCGQSFAPLEGMKLLEPPREWGVLCCSAIRPEHLLSKGETCPICGRVVSEVVLSGQSVRVRAHCSCGGKTISRTQFGGPEDRCQFCGENCFLAYSWHAPLTEEHFREMQEDHWRSRLREELKAAEVKNERGRRFSRSLSRAVAVVTAIAMVSVIGGAAPWVSAPLHLLAIGLAGVGSFLPRRS